HAEGGEEQGAIDPLLVHHGQAGLAVLVLRADRLELPEGLPDAVATGIPPVPVVEDAGSGDRVEGRIGDVRVDGAADQEAPTTIDVSPAHAPRAQGGIDVSGEGVGRLV